MHAQRNVHKSIQQSIEGDNLRVVYFQVTFNIIFYYIFMYYSIFLEGTCNNRVVSVVEIKTNKQKTEDAYPIQRGKKKIQIYGVKLRSRPLK